MWKKWRKGQESILCSSCNGWVHHNNHLKCSKLSNDEFIVHTSNENLVWNCVLCELSVLPFSDLNNNDFIINSTGLNTSTSSDVNITLDQEKLKFRANCDNLTASIDNTDDNDDESSLEIGIDSRYYDIGEFIKCKPDKTSSFSMLNLNIASLSKHIDDLRLIISLLEFNWDLIGISEHKIKKDKTPSVNIDITG